MSQMSRCTTGDVGWQPSLLPVRAGPMPTLFSAPHPPSRELCPSLCERLHQRRTSSPVWLGDSSSRRLGPPPPAGTPRPRSHLRRSLGSPAGRHARAGGGGAGRCAAPQPAAGSPAITTYRGLHLGLGGRVRCERGLHRLSRAGDATGTRHLACGSAIGRLVWPCKPSFCQHGGTQLKLRAWGHTDVPASLPLLPQFICPCPTTDRGPQLGRVWFPCLLQRPLELPGKHAHSHLCMN